MTTGTTRSDIVGRMRELLAHTLRQAAKPVEVDFDALSEQTEIAAVGLDSLTILEFLYELESAFGIEIDVAALAEMKRLGDLVDIVEGKLAV